MDQSGYGTRDFSHGCPTRIDPLGGRRVAWGSGRPMRRPEIRGNVCQLVTRGPRTVNGLRGRLSWRQIDFGEDGKKKHLGADCKCSLVNGAAAGYYSLNSKKKEEVQNRTSSSGSRVAAGARMTGSIPTADNLEEAEKY